MLILSPCDSGPVGWVSALPGNIGTSAREESAVDGLRGAPGTYQGDSPSNAPINIPSVRSTIGTTRSDHSSMLRMVLALS